jgi:vitamin B12 transporter
MYFASRSLLLAAWPAVVCVVPAHAADDPPLEAVVVTASRIPQPLDRVGSSVTVIDREQIDRRQSVFATDLLQDVPGVALSRAGGTGSQTQIRVRGAEANQVLVLIDGIRANDPGGNDEFAFENLTTWDVDRIEVVRGPQSALWGSDAVAGVINVITRPPGGETRARAWGEGGSYGTWAGGGRLSGSAAGVDYGVSLSRIDSDGTNISRAGNENDGYGNTTGTVSVGGRPADRLELSALARYTESTKSFDTTDWMTGLPGDSSDRTDADFGYYQALAAYRSSDGRWTQSLRGTFATSDLRNRNEFGSTGTTAADTLGVHYQATWRPTSTAGGAESSAYTFAAERQWQDYRQRGPVLAFDPTQVYDPNQDASVDTTSFTGEANLSPLPQTWMTLGVRYDDSDAWDSVTTWRATLAWTAPGAATRLHASYGTGQKAPTFTERFGYYPNQFLGNPDLQPEQSEGWEIGAEQPFAGDRYRLGATYFDERLTDEIDGFVYDPVSGLYTARNLDGTSLRRGVEVYAQARVADSLALAATYTYTNSTQPDLTTGLDTDEIRRPQNVASLNADWSFAAGRGGLNLNLAYTGSQTDTYYEVVPPYGARTVRLDDYTLVSLTARYDVTPRCRLYARGENLLDEDYENVYGYATPGVGVYAGLQYTY